MLCSALTYALYHCHRVHTRLVRTDVRFLLPLPFSRADSASATSWSRSVDVSDVFSGSTILAAPTMGGSVSAVRTGRQLPQVRKLDTQHAELGCWGCCSDALHA